MGRESRISAVKRNTGVEAKAHFDSYAGNCMVGARFIIIDTLDMEYKVYPYSSDYKPNIVNLVNSVLSYGHPDRKT